LKKQMPGKFVLCITEQFRADKDGDLDFGDGVYRYRKTPLPEEVVKTAERIAGIA
jgi:hypothetical protein